MSDRPEHIDPKEATEARLCAYLEGELAPEERAEIERHLVANPQHKRLLAELAKTREWMRALPRASAPPELAEAFQTTVERKMLLDDPPGRPAIAGRIGQRALLAAVVLLTLGLGTVIVVMLRGPKVGGHPVAIGPTIAPATEPTTAVETKRVTTTALAGDVSLAGAPRPVAEVQNQVDNTVTNVAPAAGNVAENVGGPTQKNRGSSDVNVGNNPVNGGVSTQQGGGLAGQQGGVGQPNQLQANDGDKAKGYLPYAAVGRQALAVFAPVDLMPRLTAAGYKPAPDQRPIYVLVTTTVPTASAKEAGEFISRHRMTAAVDKDAPVTTRPTTDSLTQTADRLIVVPGLTKPQMQSLAAAVSLSDGSPKVAMFSDVDGRTIDVQSDPAWAGAVVEAGESLTVSIPQLIDRGVSAYQTVKVADDGTVRLASLPDPVPAAGSRTSELEKRIGDRYREAAVVPQATVTVTITDPAKSADASKATTGPTTAASEVAAKPSDAAVKPVDGKFTAVLLIEPSK